MTTPNPAPSITLDKITQYMDEYGWVYHSFPGNFSQQDYAVTYVNTELDHSLRAIILIKFDEKWLYLSTHKLLKYPLSDTETILRFLKFNAQIPRVKWFTREIVTDTYLNLGCEIHHLQFNQENFFTCLDILSFYIDDTIKLLNGLGKLTEDNLYRFEEITRDSFELS